MSANSINKCTNTTHSLSNPMLSTAHISWREVNTVQSDISFTLLSAAPPTQSQPIQTHFYLWHHNRNLYTPISLPASAHTLIKIDFFFLKTLYLLPFSCRHVERRLKMSVTVVTSSEDTLLMPRTWLYSQSYLMKAGRELGNFMGQNTDVLPSWGGPLTFQRLMGCF